MGTGETGEGNTESDSHECNRHSPEKLPVTDIAIHQRVIFVPDLVKVNSSLWESPRPFIKSHGAPGASQQHLWLSASMDMALEGAQQLFPQPKAGGTQDHKKRTQAINRAMGHLFFLIFGVVFMGLFLVY